MAPFAVSVPELPMQIALELGIAVTVGVSNTVNVTTAKFGQPLAPSPATV